MAKLKLTPKEIIKKWGIGSTIDSKSRKGEMESIAYNFLVILSKTTNDFTSVTKEEYLKNREEDNKGEEISYGELVWLEKFILSSHYPLKRDFCSRWE